MRCACEGNSEMTIMPITIHHELWDNVIHYAEYCTWRAGKTLAQEMRENHFSDWERVFVAVENGCICGFCTLCKTDCIPDVSYTPYIGYLFVGEPFRGNRLSQKLITCVMEHAKNLGFREIYLVSDHINLYEKYGFIKVDEKPAPWNPDKTEAIYIHTL